MPFLGNVVEFQIRTDAHVFEHYIKTIYDPLTNRISEISEYGIDVTLKELTVKRMKSLTDYDQLNGLFNREKYSQMVERFIKDDEEYKQISLLLIDLDDFKHVNDTLGHSFGDQLLIQASNRLKHFFPDQLLFWLGGDEFAVLFTSPISRDQIIQNAQQIEDRWLKHLPLFLNVRDLVLYNVFHKKMDIANASERLLALLSEIKSRILTQESIIDFCKL
ncbi:GGDEF domain-containing protein [Bacillus sp. DJP31]|uniref:GGDEF domain-containing protein n=1 Tax=Bacillus sp. DJP31 TaxID=3409789 RepID=UPI003BB6C7BD